MTNRPAEPPDRPRGPTPATRPQPSRPADVVRDLATLLRTHGLDHLYSSACTPIAVISITPALHRLTDGHHLTWTQRGTPTTIPAHGTHQAAEHLARQPTPPTTSPGGPQHDPATRRPVNDVESCRARNALRTKLDPQLRGHGLEIRELTTALAISNPAGPEKAASTSPTSTETSPSGA